MEHSQASLHDLLELDWTRRLARYVIDLVSNRINLLFFRPNWLKASWGLSINWYFRFLSLFRWADATVVVEGFWEFVINFVSNRRQISRYFRSWVVWKETSRVVTKVYFQLPRNSEPQSSGGNDVSLSGFSFCATSVEITTTTRHGVCTLRSN